MDGTDAIAVHAAALLAVERARLGGGPQAIEALSLRGHGHAAHDGATYVPEELRARYGDPVERLAARLREDGLGEEDVERRRQEAADDVAAALAEAEAAPAPDRATLEHGVWASPV